MIKTIVTEKRVRTCDFCDSKRSAEPCEGCGRDACHYCWSFAANPWDETNEDYIVLCKPCRGRADKYRDEVKVIYRDFHEKIAESKARWKEECCKSADQTI